MNVGDYIRIDGYISKIGHMKTSSSGKTYVQWKQPNGLLASANIKLIEKSSPQIIDLIEVGDYVNGYLVKDIDYAFDDIVMNNKNARIVPYIDCNKNNYIDDIKTIVTHEQMEAMQYRVEE